MSFGSYSKRSTSGGGLNSLQVQTAVIGIAVSVFHSDRGTPMAVIWLTIIVKRITPILTTCTVHLSPILKSHVVIEILGRCFFRENQEYRKNQWGNRKKLIFTHHSYLPSRKRAAMDTGSRYAVYPSHTTVRKSPRMGFRRVAAGQGYPE